jgi:hypothetical protein
MAYASLTAMTAMSLSRMTSKQTNTQAHTQQSKQTNKRTTTPQNNKETKKQQQLNNSSQGSNTKQTNKQTNKQAHKPEQTHSERTERNETNDTDNHIWQPIIMIRPTLKKSACRETCASMFVIAMKGKKVMWRKGPELDLCVVIVFL